MPAHHGAASSSRRCLRGDQSASPPAAAHLLTRNATRSESVPPLQAQAWAPTPSPDSVAPAHPRPSELGNAAAFKADACPQPEAPRTRAVPAPLRCAWILCEALGEAADENVGVVDNLRQRNAKAKGRVGSAAGWRQTALARPYTHSPAQSPTQSLANSEAETETDRYIDREDEGPALQCPEARIGKCPGSSAHNRSPSDPCGERAN